MIPLELYKDTYYMLVSILLLFGFLPLHLKKPKLVLHLHTFFSLSLLLVVIFFIGLRDPYASPMYFGDTIAYTKSYDLLKSGYEIKSQKDIGFYYLILLFSKVFSVKIFYFFCALVYTLLPYLTYRKWFNEHSIYLFFIHVATFSFFSYGVNGLRNGLATSLFIYGLGFFNKKKIMYLLLIISSTLHLSLIIPTIFFFITNYIKRINIILAVWFICLMTSFLSGQTFINDFVLNLFDNQLSFLGDDRASIYYSENTHLEKVSGKFRFDFVLYSMIPIFIGYWAIVKKNLSNLIYYRIWGTFVLSNSFWLLMIYMPYNNRIAYLSWFIIPIILTIPFLENMRLNIKNNNLKLIYILFGSLISTLILEYGF